MSDEYSIENLNNFTTQLNRYLSIIIYLFGVIGNILNILILSQTKLRSNTCAFLFLMSSIASLIAILFGLTNRVLAGWIPDLTSTVDWLCQWRGLVLFTSRTIALWSIALATFDRWLLSSPNARQRQIRTLKNARRATILIIILSILFNAPIIYCYQANLIDTPVKCYGKTSVCRIYTDVTYACGSILIPIALMIYFSIRIILNVRRTRRCIAAFDMPRNINRPKRTKKKDRQLLIMLLVQVSFLILLTFPQAIQKLYSTITLDINITLKSSLRIAIDSFFFNFVVLLTYIASGLPFYIYTLSGGNIFRQACWKVFRKGYHILVCRHREH